MRCSFIIVGIIFSVSGLPVAAASSPPSECSSVRLDQNGGPFSKIPVYNQLDMKSGLDTGICYAILAAQLSDAARIISYPNEKVQISSPLSVAALYKMQQSLLPPSQKDYISPSFTRLFQDSPLAIGMPESAMTALKDQLICDESFMEKFDQDGADDQAAHAPTHPPQTEGSTEFIRASLDEISKVEEANRVLSVAQKKLSNSLSDLDISNYFQCTKNRGPLDMTTIIAAAHLAANQANPATQLYTFLNKLCGPNHSFKTRIPNFNSVFRGSIKATGTDEITKTRDAYMKASINNALSSKPSLPVGISYCFNVLTDTKFAGITDTDSGFRVTCSPHGSVIIGRRYDRNTNSCQFLVRNSLGPNCLNDSGKSKYAYDCEKGSIWIDSDRLMRSTMGYTTIQPL